MIEVRFKKLRPSARIPRYESAGAAGMDVAACLDADIFIAPQTAALVPTGFALEIPDGYEAQLRPRSGLALKHLISLPNSPATIDADFRGELAVILINHGKEVFTVKDGDRIAQMVFSKVERAVMTQAESLSGTERGTGGFGSTGFGSGAAPAP